METITPLDRKSRIELFIERLKEAAVPCDLAMHAYEYLGEVLQQVELEQLMPPSIAMYIQSLYEFQFIRSLHLYVWKTKQHVLFIHSEGAYAIYEKHADLNIQDDILTKPELVYYQTKATPLVSVPNKNYGRTIWQ